ncbi:hypothetical protein OG884_11855 [Streptosporangium sp. NBC_01755]|uniref:hypothetical protein n=1 Tax=unclassified Streptosporangium TaxID=2632669 RepID=UPI002DD8C553|nr:MULTISPECIES: hypothetical protein [unclassified Streptosporangium]WSA26018.1 hypothetical protein OIE13_34855 [Streptosporangium sp. NBC_01810]WSD02560.1 hypothetical protein OG884_11855 [Streptosporangium sp. NBC_01755]
MGRARRNKSTSPSRDVAARQQGEVEASDPAPPKGSPAWLAGIASAVILAVFGVVFTEWYNAHGSDTVEQVRGAAPITVGHVAVDYSERDTVLREPVTDPEGRAVMLAAHAGKQRDGVLARHQMALIDSMDVTVVLTGNRTSLRIVNIVPQVLARMPVSEGARLIAITGSGETGTVEMAADLDRPAPRFTTDGGTEYFRKKQIDLKRDERVTLSLSFTGKKAYYEFDLLVTVLADDRAEKVVIKGPDGGPFRLSGEADRYRAYYREAPQGGWRPVSCAGRRTC